MLSSSTKANQREIHLPFSHPGINSEKRMLSQCVFRASDKLHSIGTNKGERFKVQFGPTMNTMHLHTEIIALTAVNSGVPQQT